MAIIRKKGRPDLVGSPSSFSFRLLEVEAHAKLHAPRIVCPVELQKARIVNAGVDRVELRMVKHVEHLPFEVEPGLLIDREFFGESEVKVETARQVKRISADIAKSEARRYRKSVWIVVKVPSLREGINRISLGGR